MHPARSYLKTAAALLASTSFLPIAGARAQVTVDTFPETLHKAEEATRKKDWAGAARYWEQVTGANPVNGEFWESYATALYSGKEYRRAIPAFKQALELRASFPFDQAYRLACCYARLGEKEPALTWLRESFDMGYRGLKEMRSDPDLELLRQDPRFKAMAGVVDIAKMSRVEGWRTDLAFLYREIKRKHYDPYRKVTRDQFERYVRKLRSEIPRLNDDQITVRMIELMRMAGDGHTSIYPAQEQGPGIRFYLFPEGLFILGALPAHAELLGARVLKIGAHPVAEVLKAVEPLIARDNDMWLKTLGPAFLRWPAILYGLGLLPNPRELPLTIIDASGQERTTTLQSDAGHPAPDWLSYSSRLPGQEPLYLRNRAAAYWFEYLPEQKLVYFQYNAVRDDPKEPFDKFCERLFRFVDQNDVEKFVVDLRWNGGGDTGLVTPLVHGLIRCGKINQKGRLFAIIGRQTFSAAMNCTALIERNTNIIFAGEPTGSSPNFIGETVEITLPFSKMRGSISDLYWQSSWPMDYRTWIAPTLYTPPTFAAFKSQTDPALDAICAFKLPPD